ncbi:hypothetical protein ACJX0J_041777, partial [Zea mays]
PMDYAFYISLVLNLQCAGHVFPFSLSSPCYMSLVAFHNEIVYICAYVCTRAPYMYTHCTAHCPLSTAGCVAMTDDKLRREIMLISRMHPRIQVFLKNGRGIHDSYYPLRDDPKAKELSSSDIKCLNPRVSLSSSVINYYIEYIIRTKLCGNDYRDKFYIFNTFFYTKLEKDNYSKLRRWWKDTNIFHKAYLILPIYGNDHWSLIIICLPSKECNYGPIILHLDSLELHISSNIFDTVGRFLEKECDYLRKNPPPNISISEAIWEDLPKNIQKEKVHVPQQTNDYDCGIFMLYYIEQFIRDAPERFTRDNIGM